MKKYFILCAIVFSISSFGQKVDTVIDNGIYKSHYCYQLKEPLYVTYWLYKGGGNYSRKGIVFTTDGLQISAKATDYAKSGYEEGHLCNAEDFANDSISLRKTFHYYNCLPQTLKLNRGIWKHYETEIRKESQTDSLFIICGGEFQKCKFIGNGVAVPNSCWKMVFKGIEVVEILWFPNDNSDTVENIDLSELENRLGYTIKF